MQRNRALSIAAKKFNRAWIPPSSIASVQNVQKLNPSQYILPQASWHASQPSPLCSESDIDWPKTSPRTIISQRNAKATDHLGSTATSIQKVEGRQSENTGRPNKEYKWDMEI